MPEDQAPSPTAWPDAPHAGPSPTLRTLAALEARAFNRRRPGDPPAAHHLAARLGEMRSNALRLARRAGPLARDVLLILADYAEEAAVELRACEEPELAQGFLLAAEALRGDAAGFPAP